MVDLTLHDWVLIAISLLTLIPFARLIQLFVKRKIPEYLLFSVVFLGTAVSAFTDVCARHLDSLTLWQIDHAAQNTVYLVLFVHASRMTWEKTPKKLAVPVSTMYIAIIALLASWRQYTSEQDRDIIHRVPATKLDTGVVLYGLEQTLLSDVFQLAAACTFLYGYCALKPDTPSKEIRTAIRVQQLAAGILVLMTAIELSEAVAPKVLKGAFLIVVVIALFAYVFYATPEAILLSPVNISALLIYTNHGLPVSSVRLGPVSKNVQSTSAAVIAGVLTAVRHTFKQMGREGKGIKQVVLTDASMLVAELGELRFLGLVDRPSEIFMVALRNFAYRFTELNKGKMRKLVQGAEFVDIKDMIPECFPYASGLDVHEWEI